MNEFVWLLEHVTYLSLSVRSVSYLRHPARPRVIAGWRAWRWACWPLPLQDLAGARVLLRPGARLPATTPPHLGRWLPAGWRWRHWGRGCGEGSL